jgi:hypothetical protein
MGRRLAAGVERQKPADRNHEWLASRNDSKRDRPASSEEPIPVVAHLLGGGRFQEKAHQERYPRSCTESAYHPFKNNQ